MCDLKKSKKGDTCVNDQYFIGVDVGTSSVRAALVTSKGKIITVATQPINIFEAEENFFEQSSEDIWHSCCAVIQSVHDGIEKHQILGIGFDATCSLVVLSEDFLPVSVSPTGDRQWNVVMWMDHRAGKEAEEVNATKHKVLKYVGGEISLEMQIPKLKWLKKHIPESWEKAQHFFDLPDFLTWKCTGSLARSLCSTVCKWTYICDVDPVCQGWDSDFFNTVGLSDIVDKGFSPLGTTINAPGSQCGEGLTSAAAKQLGLNEGLTVATSIIDAHAGGLGCLCCTSDELQSIPIENKLAVICGTSTCHMTVEKKPIFVPGVWGPYYSAMIPDMWLNEGGQSAAGKLLDHIIESHPAYPWIKDTATTRKVHVHEVLSEILSFIVKKSTTVTSVTELTYNYHVYPDYHGNRSPLADPDMRGMISGLNLSTGAEELALQYLATLQALAYSSRHIMAAMTDSGHCIQVLHGCGGLSKNHLYVQTHADVTGLPVILPDEEESVLLGSAILAASASGHFTSITDAMNAMGGSGRVLQPNTQHTSYHERKYKVFLKMKDDQKMYRAIMEENKQSDNGGTLNK